MALRYIFHLRRVQNINRQKSEVSLVQKGGRMERSI